MLARHLVAACAALWIVGCSSLPESTHFYRFSQEQSLGLVNVYSNDSCTFLEFSYSVPSVMRLFGEAGEKLLTARSGKLIGVAGAPERFVVQMGRSSAYVERSDIPTQPLTRLRPGLLKDLEKVESELRLAPVQSASLRDALADPSGRSGRRLAAAGPNTGATVSLGELVDAAPARPTVQTDTQVMDITIDFEGQEPIELRAADDQLEDMATKVKREGGRIFVRGQVPNGATGELRAKVSKRAEAIKKMFVSRGVPLSNLVVLPIRVRFRKPVLDAPDPVSVNVTYRR